jgi:hypothetical protein
MTSDDLTAEQASRLYDELFRHVNYLLRLRKRMEDLRFERDDPLYMAVSEAYDAVWRLRQQAHGLSTQMGCRERS